jgi:leucyl/phenylalanyl-tRNA--protein transferase
LSGQNDIAAVTNDIEPGMLHMAYRQGIFPWFNEDEGEPVIWWSPNPRFVLLPQDFHVPRRLERFLKHTPYTYTFNTAFDEVIRNCAAVKRADQDGTWIGEKIIRAYGELNQNGQAFSVEARREGALAGGFYGVLLGSLFSGESMFSLLPDSAKSAFVLFMRAFFSCGGMLLDSQVYTDNISRFGAKNISRQAFLRMHAQAIETPLAKNLAEAFGEFSRAAAQRDFG